MANEKLLNFVQNFYKLLDEKPDEATIFKRGGDLLAKLVSKDDWLADSFAIPHPQFYQQYLLYADPQDLFSVVSFVWGPHQKTPLHDHMTWGLIGTLRGQEKETSYHRRPDGGFEAGHTQIMSAGQVCSVSPSTHDIHEVSNNLEHETSISIHVYGGNIGKIQRHVFDPVSGLEKSFISGYANDLVPNLWK